MFSYLYTQDTVVLRKPLNIISSKYNEICHAVLLLRLVMYSFEERTEPSRGLEKCWINVALKKTKDDGIIMFIVTVGWLKIQQITWRQVVTCYIHDFIDYF